jgi:hypothetical protein
MKFEYQIKYFNCIAFGMESGKERFIKYHSVKNTDHHREQFIQFLKNKFPFVQYVNFYDKETKKFYERVYLE